MDQTPALRPKPPEWETTPQKPFLPDAPAEGPRPGAVESPKRIDPTLTRDQVITAFGCSHSELGRLIRERRAPMPVRLDGAILWFADEIEEAKPGVARILLRRRGNFQPASVTP